MLHVSRPLSPVPSRQHISTRIPNSTQPFDLPRESDTLHMIQAYFRTTGVLFPYIDEEAFLKTYQQLTTTNIRNIRKSWLGLLNMVLAMSTNASHDEELTATERAVTSDIFFRRALALCDKEIRYGTSLEVGQ